MEPSFFPAKKKAPHSNSEGRVFPSFPLWHGAGSSMAERLTVDEALAATNSDSFPGMPFLYIEKGVFMDGAIHSIFNGMIKRLPI